MKIYIYIYAGLGRSDGNNENNRVQRGATLDSNIEISNSFLAFYLV